MFMDEYEVDENNLLGKGQFGEVLVAKSKKNEQLRICVKKMEKKQLFGEHLLKTVQEPEFTICKMMAKKKYENLVQIFAVYDSDIEDEHAYIFMERCDSSLKDLITQRKKEQKNQFTKEEIFDIIGKIAKGYLSLISEHIIHRDLKPENILYNMIDNQLQIKIADFGLSRVMNPQSNQLMTKNVGTQYYCAPEILNDKVRQNYNNECDVFSLGVIIFELAILEKQFKYKQIEKLKETTFSQLHEDVLKARVIDNEIVKLLDQMIVHNPQERLTWNTLSEKFNKTQKQSSGQFAQAQAQTINKQSPQNMQFLNQQPKQQYPLQPNFQPQVQNQQNGHPQQPVLQFQAGQLGQANQNQQIQKFQPNQNFPQQPQNFQQANGFPNQSLQNPNTNNYRFQTTKNGQYQPQPQSQIGGYPQIQLPVQPTQQAQFKLPCNPAVPMQNQPNPIQFAQFQQNPTQVAQSKPNPTQFAQFQPNPTQFVQFQQNVQSNNAQFENKRFITLASQAQKK